MCARKFIDQSQKNLILLTYPLKEALPNLVFSFFKISSIFFNSSAHFYIHIQIKISNHEEIDYMQEHGDGGIRKHSNWGGEACGLYS